MTAIRQNYINHVAFGLDMSWSMNPWRNELIAVVDELTHYLAQRSTELDQETRITAYVFNELTGHWGNPKPNIQCIYYEKDALRMPSIKDHYRPDGGTPLLDATLKSIEDLEKTPELYGDHAFLGWIVTDGEENRSTPGAQGRLERKFAALPSHWTYATLVPNHEARMKAKSFGFPADNIAIWEPTSAAGVARGGDMIRAATETFMTNRASGIRGTRSLFSTGVDAVNAQTVHDVLTPVDSASYMVVHITEDYPIREWVEQRMGRPYRAGNGFYQLTQTVTIQPQKSIMVREKKTGLVYGGPQARDLIGLPAVSVRVKPDKNPEYDIFVESQSVNRKLLAGTDLLLLK